DADGDGALDAEELARFAGLAPDLTFRIRLGKRGQAPFAEHVKGARPSALDRFVVKGKDGLPTLDLNNTRIHFGPPVAQVTETRFTFNARQQYINQFKVADKNEDGYL